MNGSHEVVLVSELVGLRCWFCGSVRLVCGGWFGRFGCVFVGGWSLRCILFYEES